MGCFVTFQILYFFFFFKIKADFSSGLKYKSGQGINLNDVKQGYLGNCYFMAAIGAIAKSDPASLKELIKDNGNGTYDVTLYLRASAKGMLFDERSKVKIRVNSELPLDKNGNPAYAQYGDKNEIWVMLIEKAYAQFYGGYPKIEGDVDELRDERGNAAEAMEILTGKSSNSVSLSLLSETLLLAYIPRILKKGIPLIVSSKNVKGNKRKELLSKKLNIVGNHAYVVKSVDIKNKTISLYNPWGLKHLPALSIKDLKRFFTDISYTS